MVRWINIRISRPIEKRMESRKVNDVDSRWMIGDWQGCTSCTFRCENTRSVKCVRPVGHSEQDVDIIADSYCEGPKPKEREPCAGREKRNNVQTRRSKRWKSISILVLVVPFYYRFFARSKDVVLSILSCEK